MVDKFGEQSYMKIRDEDSLRFVHCLSSRDPGVRQQAFDSILRAFDALMSGYGSPPPDLNGMATINGSRPQDMTAVIEEYLIDILRLSKQCPFQDVLEKCKDLLSDMQERSYRVPGIPKGGPSTFVPEREIIPASTKDTETHALFVDAFLQNNRLDHVVQLMGYHPQYLECFLRTQQYLMKGDGALPFHYRHYIAIMAASRHMCTYLIHLHEQEFILQGGDPEWLRGMSHVPKKLRDLNELNKLLAHRPWLIGRAHIENLTRSANSKDNWSISELVQALILMAHFHSLCSFVYGCGVKSEIDHSGGFSYRPPSPVEKNANDIDSSSDNSSTNGDINSEPEVGIELLMERMKKLVEEGEEETTEEERVKRFERVESQSVEIAANTVRPSPKAEVLKYVHDAEYCYQDFAKRDSVEDIPTFRATDYSWEDHGFALSNRLYMDIGNHLEDKFSVAINMTYYTMGEVRDVDTTAFRQAIWNYIHCLYGIRHDDYNYGQTNQLLERSLKAYIKTSTCYPERLTRKDYDNVMREFKHSEKIHVNLMLLEARFQAELLYALRSVMQYMT